MTRYLLKETKDGLLIPRKILIENGYVEEGELFVLSARQESSFMQIEYIHENHSQETKSEFGSS